MSYSNNIQKKALSQSIKQHKLSHAYIVGGGDADSRKEYIGEITKQIFCTGRDEDYCNACISCKKIDNGNMEDIIFVKKDGNSIKVNQIKELAVALGNKPFTSRTVAIIEDAETMTPESQNKLLKSLEEPSAGNVLILSADNIFALYPTIRSRCVIINMGTSSFNFNLELDETASNIVKYSMSNKPMNTIFDEVKKVVDSTEESSKLLDSLEIFVRDVIVGRYSPGLLFKNEHLSIVERIDWNKGYPFHKYLEHIESAKMDIKRNLNWKYTIKNLIINFKQEAING